MKNKQKGFTLIEIAAAIAVISILSAVAVSTYKNYTMKSKFAEVINMTSAIETSNELCMKEYHSTVGCSGGTNNVIPDITADNKTKYTLSVITIDGVITATARGANDSAAITAAQIAANAPPYVPAACAQYYNQVMAAPYETVTITLSGGKCIINDIMTVAWYTSKGVPLTLATSYAANSTGITTGIPFPASQNPPAAPNSHGLKNETYILTPTINADSSIKWAVSGSCVAAGLCNP